MPGAYDPDDAQLCIERASDIAARGGDVHEVIAQPRARMVVDAA